MLAMGSHLTQPSFVDRRQTQSPPANPRHAREFNAPQTWKKGCGMRRICIRSSPHLRHITSERHRRNASARLTNAVSPGNCLLVYFLALFLLRVSLPLSNPYLPGSNRASALATKGGTPRGCDAGSIPALMLRVTSCSLARRIAISCLHSSVSAVFLMDMTADEKINMHLRTMFRLAAGHVARIPLTPATCAVLYDKE